MPDDFDAQDAAAQLSAVVQDARANVEKLKPPAERMSLFTAQPDGSVTDRNGRVLRGRIEPLPAKGK